jgi:chaperonin GroEL (HSP60 family)
MQQGGQGQQIMVMNTNAKRETGSIARANNIAAAKAVSDIIRTTLGPRSMLKMILDASGGTTKTMTTTTTTTHIASSRESTRLARGARAIDETRSDRVNAAKSQRERTNERTRFDGDGTLERG